MVETTDRIEARTVAKISWRLLPLLGACYLTSILDRGNVSFAAVTMNAELGFSEAVYGLGVACFFISYALFEVPSNLLLNRFGARRWIARIMVTWGLVSMAMMVVRTPWEFYGLRFLLGMAEAGFVPGVAHYISEWLPAHQRARAISRFYIASPLSYIVLGATAPPLLALHGALGLSGWQWLFIIQGLPAVVLGIVLLFALPDRVDQVAWLDEREKAWLTEAINQSMTLTGQAPKGLRAALLHPIVLTAGLALMLSFGASNAVAFSFPKIMAAQLHWSVDGIGAITALSGLLGIPAMLVAGIIADRMAQPSRLAGGLLIASAIGAVMLLLGGASLVAVVGGVLFTLASLTGGLMLLTVLTRFVHPSARAAGIAMSNTMGQTGAILGPALWGIAATGTGSFSFGLTAVAIVMFCAAIVAVLIERLTAGRAKSSGVVETI